MTPEEAAAAVARAWNDPGPVPEYHRAAQLRLHQEWPTLAAAVEQLANPRKADRIETWGRLEQLLPC